MKKFLLIGLLFLVGCTEEARNKFSRSFDNLVGSNLKVSYVSDYGTIVQTWIVRDGKITSGKAEDGSASYYYFWDEKGLYVQVPIGNTIIQEFREDDVSKIFNENGKVEMYGNYGSFKRNEFNLNPE